MTKNAVILLSGGLDSATTAYIAKQQGYHLYALSFDYGQRHTIELDMACKQAKHVGVVEHKIATIDLRLFGGSALTDDIAVPQADTAQDIGKDIPVTYVPARNTIFLSFALAYAEVTHAQAIFLGVNALDYSGYPDCRPDYIASFEVMANLATKSAVNGQKLHIHTPLINLTKAQIIEQGLALGVNYDDTISCYTPDDKGKPCGKCDACLLRNKGFAEI